MRYRIAKYQKPELIRLGDVEVGRVINFSAISNIESQRAPRTYIVLGRINGEFKTVWCYHDTDDELFFAEEDRLVLALNLYAEQDGDRNEFLDMLKNEKEADNE